MVQTQTHKQTKSWRRRLQQHIKWTLYTAWNFHARCWSCIWMLKEIAAVFAVRDIVIILHRHMSVLCTFCTRADAAHMCVHVCMCVYLGMKEKETALCSWCFINTSVTTEMKYLLSAGRGRAAEIAIFTAGAAASILYFNSPHLHIQRKKGGSVQVCVHKVKICVRGV